MSLMLAFVQAMRPQQWTKNLFVFAGLVFAAELGNIGKVLTTFQAFFCFCVLSSAVYFVNDIVDRHRDQLHPRKKNRPIASGRLPLPVARAGFVALSVAGLAWAALLGPEFGGICAGYLVLMLAYTFGLKHQVILDVFVIAAGFVLRALGGALVIDVPISQWLIVCTILVSLFLALGKRRAELVTVANGVGHREALRDYTVAFIDQMISVVTAATIVSYTFYAFQSGTAESRHGGLMLTVPLVLYGLFRYLYLLYCKEQGGSPEQMVIEDRPLLVSLILWGALSAVIMWNR